jgi:hypothetical protein
LPLDANSGQPNGGPMLFPRISLHRYTKVQTGPRVHGGWKCREASDEETCPILFLPSHEQKATEILFQGEGEKRERRGERHPSEAMEDRHFQAFEQVSAAPELFSPSS